MPTDDFVVTPWNVEGDIDYDKLIKRFGTQKITPDLLSKIEKFTNESHFMLTKGNFFLPQRFESDFWMITKRVRNSFYTQAEDRLAIHILVIWSHGFLQNGFKTSLEQKCIFSLQMTKNSGQKKT